MRGTSSTALLAGQHMELPDLTDVFGERKQMPALAPDTWEGAQGSLTMETEGEAAQGAATEPFAEGA